MAYALTQPFLIEGSWAKDSEGGPILDLDQEGQPFWVDWEALRERRFVHQLTKGKTPGSRIEITRGPVFHSEDEASVEVREYDNGNRETRTVMLRLRRVPEDPSYRGIQGYCAMQQPKKRRRHEERGRTPTPRGLEGRGL